MKINIAYILILIGLFCILFAEIMQCVVCVQMYGVIFKQVFIPHWSAWFFLGFIPIITGYTIIKFD